MDTEKEYKHKVYPRLETPSAPPSEDKNIYVQMSDINDVHDNYRLQYIQDIKKYLEQSSEQRLSLSKKYTKLYNSLHYTNYFLNFISTGAAVGSVSTLSTVLLIPVSIGLGAVSIGCGGLSIIISKLNKKIKSKQDKHRDIYNLAETKLSTIESLLSKSLQDNKLSHNEFTLILEEEKRFRENKEKIRNKKFYNENDLKEKGRNEIRESFKRLLAK